MESPLYPEKTVLDRLLAIGQSLGTLLLLILLLPFNLIVVLAVCFLHALQHTFSHQSHTAIHPKTILLTGGKMTKALQLARSFYAAGHRVILAETHKYWLSGHRFSNAIDQFYTVPNPKQDPQGFIQGLVDIVQREQVDIFIPVTSPIESYYASVAKPELSQFCEVFHFDVEMTEKLDNKFEFNEMASAIGLPTPRTVRITDPQQILDFDFEQDGSQYILKSIAYDSVHRLDMTRYPMASREETIAHLSHIPISSANPWILQQFLPGQEYCTHSTVRNGQITLHCCSKSSAFQVNYEQVDHPKILQWVTRFVEAYQLTGQVSFDFIEQADGTVYAIECNPRTHSAITMFYNHPGVADAYLSQASSNTPIQPLPTSKPTYWTYHELWRLTEVRSLNDLVAWLKKMQRGTDALLQINDPLPFLMVHHWQIPLLLLNAIQHQKRWIRIDFNIGKLVELGGD